MKIILRNTLTGRNEAFEPLSPGEVRMYHCGPTVSGPPSVDKFRSYLLGDVLRRIFQHRGLAVRQVMNITDVGHLNEFDEDAVEISAGRSGLNAWELVQEEEKAFHEDRRALNILDAHVYPRAREHVPEMIEFIAGLLASEAAYRVEGNVFFDSSRSPAVGRLAGRPRSELEAAARAEGDRPGLRAPSSLKRNPLDFHLWRPDPVHQMHWPSPWGRGFPGWHVECVVMSRKYLGTPFDIHTGSEDNVYPHHDCEIAQAEAAGSGELARFWVHSRHVLLSGRPISRANRNLITVRGLRETGAAGPEIRGALLSARFDRPLELAPELLDEARETIGAFRQFRGKHRPEKAGEPAAGEAPDRLRDRIAAAEEEFDRALDDDLDVPRAIQAVRRFTADADAALAGRHPRAAEAMERFDKVLGIL